ncbi:MAG TPA: PH domain-containing protein [Chthoniobacterales bacterium]|jgi:hypothetical protein|nr:PH domain-containing protein [Chthoniobacterales bacterium]
MNTYDAHWGTSLIVISSLTTLLIAGVIAGMIWRGYHHPWTIVFLGAIIGIALLFTIRGYSITPDAIIVHRLFWNTRLPRAELASAKFDPNATDKSIRTFGNGGLFSFSGFYHNHALGNYRAFLTDPKQTVVLTYPKRTVVISPTPSEDFVRELMATTSRK